MNSFSYRNNYSLAVENSELPNLSSQRNSEFFRVVETPNNNSQAIAIKQDDLNENTLYHAPQSVQETSVLSPKEHEQINQLSAFYDQSSEIASASLKPATSPHASKSEIDIAVNDQQNSSDDVSFNRALDYLETADEITLLELQTVLNIDQSIALLLMGTSGNLP